MLLLLLLLLLLSSFELSLIFFFFFGGFFVWGCVLFFIPVRISRSPICRSWTFFCCCCCGGGGGGGAGGTGLFWEWFAEFKWMRKFCRGVGDFCFVSEVLVLWDQFYVLRVFIAVYFLVSCVCVSSARVPVSALFWGTFSTGVFFVFVFILGGIFWVSGFELTVSHERCCLSTAEFVASIGSWNLLLLSLWLLSLFWRGKKI